MFPVSGCRVKHKRSETCGTVEGNDDNYVRIRWRDKSVSLEIPSILESGFYIGMYVQEVPRTPLRTPLGAGYVLDNRQIGSRSQVLVEFLSSGSRLWIPYENLKAIAHIEQHFCMSKVGKHDNAERFRLKTLAYAIELWNENTGALSHLDIDPLPHQIHLVHHILNSGNYNWLIADDVGLGKTVEVGMLLSALIQRKDAKRILIVTPSGLVKQWREEMRHKFKLEDFRIFGHHFDIHEPSEWKLYDRVIASIDRLKREENLATLLNSDDWDIIIFDEGHRLTRRQRGLKIDASGRFKLAAALRRKTESIVLLSATPHQGMQDKFQALLELLRPDMKKQIKELSINPEFLREIVIRNNKSEVTDLEGNLIFRGKVTHNIPIKISAEEDAFGKALQEYLKEGYKASKSTTGKLSHAIGFVMTIYRKIAASSIPAIEKSLQARLNKLSQSQNEIVDLDITKEDDDFIDERFQGEIFEKDLEPVDIKFVITLQEQFVSYRYG